MKKQIIFSGLKPTGTLNIGTYLGAVKNWIELQNSGEYEMFIFIADLHSLNSDLTPEALREFTHTVAAEILSCGIDPNKVTFFVQSHIPEHAELTWILTNTTPVSELFRMTQFKDKSQKQAKNINAGLLNYPILMAADILLYKGTLIPVGQDQIQHVELTRDIARWFNNRYGDFFPEVKHVLTEVPKVMGILEPTKKMSKSDGANNVIELADEPEVIINKLKRAVTATSGGTSSPGAENLLLLLKTFGKPEQHEQFAQAEKDGTIRYGDLKQTLATAIADYFADFRAKRNELLQDRKKLEDILASGAKKARQVAEQTMVDVRKLVGIR